MGAIKAPRVARGHAEVKSYDVRSVGRAVSVLGAFQDIEELSLADLSKRLHLPKPTLFRLAATLEHEGMLERTPNGSYRLGFRLVSLARLVLTRGLPGAAQPYLASLSHTFGYTVNLGVLSAGEILFIDAVESRERFRVVPAIGSREALHATAIGKAIASSLDSETLSRILRDRPLRPLTPRTIVTRAKFEAELSRIREHGYATDQGECHLGAHCIGAVILGGNGVVGGLSVSATSDQLPREDFPVVGAAVADAARRINEALGTSNDGQRADARSAHSPRIESGEVHDNSHKKIGTGRAA